MIKRIKALTGSQFVNLCCVIAFLGLSDIVARTFYTLSIRKLFLSLETRFIPDYNQSIVYAAVSVVLAVFVYAFGKLLLKKTAVRIVANIRRVLIEQITKLPLSRLERDNSGNVFSRVDILSTEAKTMYQDFIPNGLISTTSGIYGIVIVALIDWRLTLFICIYGIVYSLIIYKVLTPLRGKAKAMLKAEFSVVENVSDGLNGFFLSKQLGLENPLINNLNGHQAELLKNQEASNRLETLVYAIERLLRWVTDGGIVIFGIWLVLRGYSSFAGFMTVYTLKDNVMNLFTSVSSTLVNSQRAMASIERVEEMLSEPVEDVMSIVIGSIGQKCIFDIKKLTFSYENNPPLFDQLSLIIPGEKSSAIMGESGCGKSTLLKIIAGLYKADGKIYINDTREQMYTLNELREIMCYVPQQPHIFPGTIRENITCGKSVTQQELEYVTQISGALDFIREKSECFDTLLNENGVGLSHGQKQRISLARALLRKPKILLLDEATSGLDYKTENELMSKVLAINEITVLSVTHRHSTLSLFENYCNLSTLMHSHVSN